MTVFPSQSEVLVSAFRKRQVLDAINEVTLVVDYTDISAQKPGSKYFNGKVQKDGFQVSLWISRADSFLPLIAGKVEDTAMGSIVFLEYRLFPSTRFFLGFWTVVTILMGIFLALQQLWLYAVLATLLSAANFGLAAFFFRRRVATSQEIFHRLLEPGPNNGSK